MATSGSPPFVASGRHISHTHVCQPPVAVTRHSGCHRCRGKPSPVDSPCWVASFCLWARRDPATPGPSTSCLPRRPSSVTLDSLDGSVPRPAPAALAHTHTVVRRERDGRKDQHFATVAEGPGRPAEASSGGQRKARKNDFRGSFTVTG